jgi:hypothetical protein
MVGATMTFMKQVSYSLAVILGMASLAAAQSQKKSVWQQIKDAANQTQQQKGQQQNGQQGQRPDKRGGPAPQYQANDSGPFKPPAGTNIQETVLAPVQEGAKFEISPHGVHVATVATDGSRTVVYYDGVEGAKFDEIIPQEGNGYMAFSPDGKRYAYCARSGNQYVVMVDGKQLARSSESQGGIFNTDSCRLGFTSNNKHVYYYSAVTLTNPSTWGYRRFVFDGKAEIPNATEWNSVAFSPDGDHYAYVWSDPKRQKPWMLIVDGKPAPYQGESPQWTNDSKHLYTQRRVPGSNTTELMFDGKPLTRAFGFKVYIVPVGDMVAVAVTGGTDFHPFSFLVLNGKKVPGSDTVERGSIDNVVFSPDGKHYAAICGDINSHHYVILDGKRQQEYVSVDKLAFTLDSSTVVYTTYVNGKSFIVVGDKEFGGPVGTVQQPVLAPAGNRVAGMILVNGRPSLLIDQKVVPVDTRSISDVGFSPDGVHYAYLGYDSGTDSHLVLDGVRQAQSSVSGDRIDPVNVSALKYVFSPDSKHVAHFANSPAGIAVTRGVFVDGKFIPISSEGSNTHLLFSPDSKHIFWVHQYGDLPLRVFIDGKPLMDFYSPTSVLGSAPHWWDFGPDGTVSFLAQDDNSLKRITITPSAETSVATMTGTFAAVNR